MIPKQETFDTVVAHLRKQKRQAKNSEAGQMCQYLAANGDKCAVGCLIPEDRYSEDLEGEVVHGGLSDDPNRNTRITILMHKLGHDLGLCKDLQAAHDHLSPEGWESEFESIASWHGLAYSLPS